MWSNTLTSHCQVWKQSEVPSQRTWRFKVPSTVFLLDSIIAQMFVKWKNVKHGLTLPLCSSLNRCWQIGRCVRVEWYAKGVWEQDSLISLQVMSGSLGMALFLALMHAVIAYMQFNIWDVFKTHLIVSVFRLVSCSCLVFSALFQFMLLSNWSFPQKTPGAKLRQLLLVPSFC